MNPSPDRGKECLPPKKREFRDGSANQHPPLDEFKPPATPPRSRPSSSSGRGEGGRGSSEEALTNRHSLLPSIPPPLPSPCIPLPLPWHLAYPSSVPFLSLKDQVGKRDYLLPTPFPHHSRCLQGEILPPSPSSSSSSFKSPFPTESRDMWSYFNTGRRDYSSSLFSPSHLFSQPSLYPLDHSLTEGRHRYLGKRPNGLDVPGSRTASASRVALPSGEYKNEPSGSARLCGSPHGSHANGRRRHQEVPTGRFEQFAGFRDFQATLEGPDSHSSLQDRDPCGTPKAGISTLIPTSPQPHGADTRAGRGELLDPLGGSVAEAHVHCSLASVYSTLQPSQLSTQAQAQRYPLYSPSCSSLYGLHTMRNSQHSTQGQPNSHSTEEKDRERDRQQEQEREREPEGDRDIREIDNKRGGNKDSRELSPGQQYSRPLASPFLPHKTASPSAPHHIPPALLPHFAKGSLIELVGGRLKRVEELRTEDFLRSADTSPEFHLSTCTVLLIGPSNTHGFNHLQVLLTDSNTQELLTVLVEYPFFVRDRGWSSCCPQRTAQLYGLTCRQLSEGDICLALTPLHTHTVPRGHRTHTQARASTHREDMPPPLPPPPLPHPSPALVPPPLPPPPVDPPTQEQPRPRKRRWSAPDLLPPTGTTGIDKTTNLPHGSKQRKWQ